MGEFFSSDNLEQYIAFAGRHQIMVIVFFALLVALIYFQVKIMIAGVKKVSASAATSMVNHENGVFIDVRANSLFSKGHIAGSVNITLDEIKQGKLNRVESFKNNPVIVVGKDKVDSDNFNAVVALKKQGYTQAFLLEGGIAQWAMDNLPLSVKN